MAEQNASREEPEDILLWVAWMARWGQPAPSHAYSAGIFSCPHKAEEAGRQEALDRGGKYAFQHAPCHVDMLNIPCRPWMHPKAAAPESVYLCSVFARPSLGRFSERHHLVGLFTSEARARDAAAHLYPGWSVQVTQERVNPPGPSASPA